MGAADVSDTGEGRGFATTAVEAKEDAGSMWGGDYKYDGGTHRGGRAGRVWVVFGLRRLVKGRSGKRVGNSKPLKNGGRGGGLEAVNCNGDLEGKMERHGGVTTAGR